MSDATAWRPEPGGFINISLPDELIRATVMECPDKETVVAILNVTPPVSKTHSYRQNDVIAARRERDEFGRDLWRVIHAA
ncbi:hypothetical protein [Ancylobacter sp.]|uniref:hypothetical protein n=1 Tax=Ancylobacter sp. TaxID=1872567 RepID=UPI003BABA74D